MAKYLDWGGLLTFWSKIKSWVGDYAKITIGDNKSIQIGSNTLTPILSITAGAGLNTTSNDSDADGGVIGIDSGLARSGTIHLTKSGVTADSYGPSANASLSAGSSFSVPHFTVDKYGRVTAASTKSITVPSNLTIKQDGLTGATINRYGTCSTAADTAAKTVSVTSGTVPTLDSNAAGLKVTVKFTNANTAGTPTLNVNSKGAKNIYHKGALITTGTNKSLLAGVCDFIYDGTLWHLVGNYVDTLYTVGNKALKVSSDSGTATLAITMNESSADRTLLIKGDGTYLSGAVSGSANAPVITISHKDPTADANSELTGSISGTAGSYALGTEYTVLTGVKAQRDAKGHITGLTYTAQKVKDTDTKNTAGSTNSSSKLFIIGATSQAANPLTYSQDTAYVGTDGHLYSDSKLVVNLSGSLALTNKTYNGYTLAAACAKGVVTSISSDSTNLPTVTAVKDYVSSLMSSVVGALVYQGTISAESTLLNTALSKGWYYIVTMPDNTTTNVTIGGVECEAGDMIIVKTAGTYTTSTNLGAAIDVVQSNIEVITDSEINGLT